MFFVAPVHTREQALELAKSAPALRVRPLVVTRWAKFMTAARQGGTQADVRAPRLNEPMIALLGQTTDAWIVPEDILRGSLHTTAMEQARILLRLLRDQREGYAHTRGGHEDDPHGQDPDAELAHWELSDTVGRGESGRQHDDAAC